MREPLSGAPFCRAARHADFNLKKKKVYCLDSYNNRFKQGMFLLHPRLEADSIVLGDLPLSRLLLMNDSRYPWCILVPRREDLSEIYQLDAAEQQQLWQESALLGRGMMEAFGGDKLNLAALGNLVPQLHLHHIVRYLDDATWPGPVWGVGTPEAYTPEQLDEVRRRLTEVLPAQWFN